MVRKACSNIDALNELNRLVSAINKAIKDALPNKVPPEHIPKVIYISDSIVLHLYEDSISKCSKYNSTDAVILISILIYQYMISEGFVIRGCINKDLAWCDGKNIIGPAYMDAVSGEKEVANPFIGIKDTAIKHATFNELIKKYHGENVLHVFNIEYLKDKNISVYQYAGISQILEKQLNLAHQQLHKASNAKRQNKWISLIKFILETTGDELSSHAEKLGLSGLLDE